MKKMVTLSLAALMSTATLGMAAPAAAQPGYYHGGYDAYSASYDRDHRRYDRYDRRGDRYDRRDYRNDRRYYQGNRRYRQCDNGTGGTVIGAIAGGRRRLEFADAKGAGSDEPDRGGGVRRRDEGVQPRKWEIGQRLGQARIEHSRSQ